MAGTGRQQQSTENGSRHVFFVCYSGIGGQPHSNSNGCSHNLIELNVEVDPGKKIRYGSGKFGTGTSSRIRTGNLFSVGTGTEIST